MQRQIITRRFALLAVLLCDFVAHMTAGAAALPVFAHRFGFQCQACHTTVPQLNEFGLRFRASGFRLLPPVHHPFPVAVKVDLAYSSDPDPAGLPKALVDEVELLGAGTIGKSFNYFLEQYAIDGGTPGRTRDAWVQYNAAGLSVRGGQFTLPLPVDPESERPTLAHYSVLEPLFDARAGVDFMYAGNRGLELHAAALNDGGAALHLYASQTFASGTSLFAYAYHSPLVRADGIAASQRIGKASILALAQNGGSFVEGQYGFSSALTLTARKEQGATIVSFALRPRRNMRLTLEDRYTDHHALGIGWLFAY